MLQQLAIQGAMSADFIQVSPFLPAHSQRDSERLLRAHNAWVPWDNSDQPEEPGIDTLVKEAFKYYTEGYFPIQVKWKLAERHSRVPPRTLARARRLAERALLAAEQAPPELRRAQVAAARQTAIQEALAAGQWGAALKGLERAGEIAGELRESAGLSEEDLVLTVAIEAPPEPPALPETAETGETGDETEG